MLLLLFILIFPCLLFFLSLSINLFSSIFCLFSTLSALSLHLSLLYLSYSLLSLVFLKSAYFRIYCIRLFCCSVLFPATTLCIFSLPPLPCICIPLCHPSSSSSHSGQEGDGHCITKEGEREVRKEGMEGMNEGWRKEMMSVAD